MSEPFVAEVRMFAGNFAPRGWALCNGQLLAISQNQALFSLLGTIYGGNGTTTFALPNLQGRMPTHFGQGPGLSHRVQGEAGGSTSVTLTTAQIPAHNHALRAAATADTGTPSAAVALAATASARTYAPAANLVTMGAALGNTGGGLGHENRQPFLGVNFIISLVGIYPSRN